MAYRRRQLRPKAGIDFDFTLDEFTESVSACDL